MREEIIKLEEELRLAMLSNDVAKLDELIADTLVFTVPSGDVVTKQIDLEGHSSGLQKTSELAPLEQQILVYDDFAVVIVKMHIAGTYGDDSMTGTYRYMRVWGKVNNRFQVVAGTVFYMGE